MQRLGILQDIAHCSKHCKDENIGWRCYIPSDKHTKSCTQGCYFGTNLKITEDRYLSLPEGFDYFDHVTEIEGVVTLLLKSGEDEGSI